MSDSAVVVTFNGGADGPRVVINAVSVEDALTMVENLPAFQLETMKHST